ncbi:MAG: 3-isopropylmalate dehydratase [Acidobacteria bacterium]|nr:MAG: 3-isopropylmalate dehydratase [Acidobacteriota bacterium]
MKFSGRIWVLTGQDGRLIDDIDTDMIFHNRYLAETDIAKMGQYALDNLAGWEDFAKKALPGDIVIAGRNFGAGSSRQQAVDCFKSLKISLLIAESFGAIYKRNAINSAFPILEAPGISDADFVNGDMVEVDSATGEISGRDGKRFKARPFPQVQADILSAGGLFQYARRLER